jgi:hypothetical protein
LKNLDKSERIDGIHFGEVSVEVEVFCGTSETVFFRTILIGS